MAKNHSEFICQQCGYHSPGFMGKCPQCGQWNSLVETAVSSDLPVLDSKVNVDLVKLSDVKGDYGKRMPSGFSEFDRVLGGGIVPGSIVLIAGDPGIGKSTLLLQCAMRIANKSTDHSLQTTAKKKRDAVDSRQKTLDNTVLYVTGEESPQQVKIRADRLGKVNQTLFILPQTNVDAIVAASA